MCIELGRAPVLVLGGANPPLMSINNDLQCRAKDSRASKNGDGGRAAAASAEREVLLMEGEAMTLTGNSNVRGIAWRHGLCRNA